MTSALQLEVRVGLNTVTWTYSRLTGQVILAQRQEDEMSVVRPSGRVWHHRHTRGSRDTRYIVRPQQPSKETGLILLSNTVPSRSEP